MMRKIGSDWGGWLIETSLIRDDGIVISAGLGNDITFDSELMITHPNLRVIGIDPTDVAEKTVNSLPEDLRKRYTHIKKALSDNNDDIALGGDAVSIMLGGRTRMYPCTTIGDYLTKDVCMLKMDIEGSEYPVLDTIEGLSVEQIGIEWHHWLKSDLYTIHDTLKMIDKIVNFGYVEVARSTNEPHRIIQESLFVRRDLVGRVNFA